MDNMDKVISELCWLMLGVPTYYDEAKPDNSDFVQKELVDQIREILSQLVK